MSTWKPDLTERTGPRYLAIADAIARDIETGVLKSGDQLPTHRDLADNLGLTVGTITRAYQETERRGLTYGHTGRGTFVKNEVFDDFYTNHVEDNSLIDFSFNYTPITFGDTLNRSLASTFANFSKRKDLTSMLLYKHHKSSARHQSAGAEWIARTGLPAPAEQILVCNGALHAMTLVFSVLSSPGDTIMAEELTYPGMKSLANSLRLNLQGVAIDKHGIVPKAFDKCCREGRSKILYCVPTIQNPTTSIMPEERRRELAEIARKHDVLIVEDDVYGFLVPDGPKPISIYAPERCYYITSLSKSVAGGLRIGYLLTPPRMQDRFEVAIKTTIWMASPFSAEIASEWIKDGTAVEIAGQKRKEAIVRQEIAQKIIGVHRLETNQYSYHLLLHLSEQWNRNQFVTEARKRSVSVTPPEAFTISQTEVPNAVRLCIGGPSTRSLLEDGLRIITGLLAESPRPLDPII